ncbi:hypothetical protein, partial [Asticcacaulis taihuensis]|uniref:hypothetical protein n=1 Tax=Asticcacaulis taihuensis TaxID=260084 RepID=UPI003F68BBB1
MVEAVKTGVITYNLAGTSLGPYATYSGGQGALYEVASEIQVIIETDGVEAAPLTINTQYTLTGATPLTSGGTVTLNASVRPGADWASDGKARRLILRRMTVLEQQQPFGEVARFQPPATEYAFDKLTRASQDLIGRAARAVVVPQGEAGLSVPLLAARKGMLATFNATTGNMEAVRSLVAFDADVANTATKATAAASSASAAALSAAGALDLKNQTQSLRDQSQGILDSITPAGAAAIGQIVAQYNTASA